MNEFILAVALICGDANDVWVRQVLTMTPITQEHCDRMAMDVKLREAYGKPPDKKKCATDLICVHVRWTD